MTYMRDILVIVLTIFLIGLIASYLMDRKACIDSKDPDTFECFIYRGTVFEVTTTKTQNYAP